jgi:ADP-ribose pyrophosphatase
MDYQFKILERSVCYKGFLSIEKYRLRHELFKGGWSDEITRECMERDHAVAVLLYDPDLDQVILLEQFRVGALASPGGPWLTEIVAGVMDDSCETGADAARREVSEEAGCEILELVLICQYLVSPGGTSETMTLFCGRIDSTTVSSDSIHGVSNEHEDIKVRVIPRTKVMCLLHEGFINSAASIIALQWLEINQSRLLEQWLVL